MTSGVMMTPRRRLLLVLTLIGLGPVLILARSHSGPDVAYLVPFVCFPIPALLAGAWPNSWSMLTLAGYGAVVGFVWILIRRAGAEDGWRRVPVLSALSLAGPAVLFASVALFVAGTGPFAFIWSGVAAAALGIVLLNLTRGIDGASPEKVWILRIWLAGVVLVAGWVAVFGLLAGLCC